MRIDPANIPQNVQGTNFEAPKYEPKEIASFGGSSIMTENYIEEVENILDPDGDGYDEKGNLVKQYRRSESDSENMEKAQEWIEYMQYDEKGNLIATYSCDNETKEIVFASYREYDEDGNQTAYYEDYGNDGVDYAIYETYDEDGNQTAAYGDFDNDGK